jgi:BirA family biotin operon repressor/biotin-[acetyl-CoA-carboxylase] ligase
MLQRQGLTSLLEEYRAHSVTVGHPVQVLDGQRRFDAYALDIAGDGGLVVRLEDGQEKVLHAGEVSIRG